MVNLKLKALFSRTAFVCLLTGCLTGNSPNHSCKHDPLPSIRLGGAWSARASGTSQTLTDVKWTGSRFVAIGAPDTILTSPDGQVWQAIAASGSLTALAWSGEDDCTSANPNLLVAVGAGGKILTSPDGLTWIDRTSGTTGLLLSIGWTGHLFIAVGSGGTILTSQDGIVWSSRVSGTTAMLRDVAWNDSLMVVVGDAILSSSDGATWTSKSAGEGNGTGLTWVSWSSDGFTANNPGSPPVSEGYTLHSVKGELWEKRQGSNQTRSTHIGTQAVSFKGPSDVSTEAIIYISPSLDTIPVQNLGVIFDPAGVAWNGSRLVVVGSRGTIVTLP
jgi:hypothetical protein